MLDNPNTKRNRKMPVIRPLKCKRCGYEWIPRSFKKPNNCAGCNSRIWNKPKKIEKADEK